VENPAPRPVATHPNFYLETFTGGFQAGLWRHPFDLIGLV